MLIPQENPTDQENAELMTLGILSQMEHHASGDREVGMILGNSMIAAARMLFKRMGIDEHQQRELYREFWKPMVDKGVEE